jgi:hypothetical protein
MFSYVKPLLCNSTVGTSNSPRILLRNSTSTIYSYNNNRHTDCFPKLGTMVRSRVIVNESLLADRGIEKSLATAPTTLPPQRSRSLTSRSIPSIDLETFQRLTNDISQSSQLAIQQPRTGRFSLPSNSAARSSCSPSIPPMKQITVAKWSSGSSTQRKRDSTL